MPWFACRGGSRTARRRTAFTWLRPAVSKPAPATGRSRNGRSRAALAHVRAPGQFLRPGCRQSGSPADRTEHEAELRGVRDQGFVSVEIHVQPAWVGGVSGRGDGEYGARDPGRIVGGQKQGSPGHVLGLADAAEWIPPGEALEDLRVRP